MVGKKEPYTHPFDYFVVETGIKYTHEAIMHGDFKTALTNLYWFTGWLSDESLNDLSKEIGDLEKIVNGEVPIEIDMIRKPLRKIQLALRKQLHKEYLIKATFRPPTRTSSLKDLEKRLEAAH